MKTKDTHWFSHDQNAFNDMKIELLRHKYGYAGYGRWWHLVEILRGETGYKYEVSGKYGYVSLANKLQMTLAEVNEFIIDLIEYGLLQTDEFFIWSNSLNGRMEYWESSRRKYSNMGKKSAENKKLKKLTIVKESVNAVEENDNTVTTQLHNISTNETKRNETKQNNKEEEEVIPTTTTTTNFLSSEAMISIAILQQNVMNDDIYFVTPLCMQFGIEPPKLQQWLAAFNKHLGMEHQHLKTSRDYREHFLHWLKYQDVATGNPDNWKPVTQVRYGKTGPPPQPTAEEILAQRAAEEEYYLKLNQQLKP